VSDRLIDTVVTPGALQVRFQPVLDVSSKVTRIHSVEALVSGPSGSTLEKADLLFEYVRLTHEEARADRACVTAILAESSDLPPDIPVAINVHAASLARDPGFVEYLRDAAANAGVAAERLTVEIVEFAPEWCQGEAFAENLKDLRDLGMGLALDDLGQGHSNFKMVLDCRPDYLKLDRYFVAGMAKDRFRRGVLESVLVLARHFGARVIVEGVEEQADLRVSRLLGAQLAQGYLFSPAVMAGALRTSPFLRAALP
jgi:EAL domain-containing protein (putative c-di-GMP-specific phosphodiesterase class I)